MNNYEDWALLVAKKLKGEADLIAAIEKDELEDTAATEAFVQSVLRPFIPENYGIGSGRIVDAFGTYSDHLEVVIYNRDFPRIGLPGTQAAYLYESVLATFSIRAKFIRKTFFESLDACASLAELETNIDKPLLIKLAKKNGLKPGPNKKFFHEDPLRTARFELIGRPPGFVFGFSGIKHSHRQLRENIELWLSHRDDEGLDTSMKCLPAVIATQGCFAWRNAAPLALSNREMMGIGNDDAPIRLIVLQLLYLLNRRLHVTSDGYGLKPNLNAYLSQFSAPKFEVGVGDAVDPREKVKAARDTMRFEPARDHKQIEAKAPEAAAKTKKPEPPAAPKETTAKREIPEPPVKEKQVTAKQEIPEPPAKEKQFTAKQEIPEPPAKEKQFTAKQEIPEPPAKEKQFTAKQEIPEPPVKENKVAAPANEIRPAATLAAVTDKPSPAAPAAAPAPAAEAAAESQDTTPAPAAPAAVFNKPSPFASAPSPAAEAAPPAETKPAAASGVFDKPSPFPSAPVPPAEEAKSETPRPAARVSSLGSAPIPGSAPASGTPPAAPLGSAPIPMSSSTPATENAPASAPLGSAPIPPSEPDIAKVTPPKPPVDFDLGSETEVLEDKVQAEEDEFENTVIIPPNAGASNNAAAKDSTNAFIARVKEQLSSPEEESGNKQDAFSSTIPQ